MANPPFQPPQFPNDSSCQAGPYTVVGFYISADGSIQRTGDRHISPQTYGPIGHGGQVVNTGWETSHLVPHTQTPGTMHGRSASEHLQTTPYVPENSILLNRRGSVPSNVYLSQSHPVQGYLPGSQTLQGYPPMPQDQYQQPQIQPAMSDLVAHRPTPSLTIPSATGGHFPGPHSASPPHTPWYTPQPSPHPPPHPQLNPEFTFGTPFHVDQGTLTVLDVGYGGGGRIAADRTSRSNSRVRPYQHHRTSWTSDDMGQMQVVGSSVDLPPVASSSQIRLDDSESATSPGADSDFYHSIPNTPADAGRVMSEEFDEAAKRKERQKLKKQDDRRGEKSRYSEVKKLLKLSPKVTKIDTLEEGEYVIKFFNGNIPDRPTEPTPALRGRDRNERAVQVCLARLYVTALFGVIAKLAGYVTESEPKREQLLAKVAKEIEQRTTGTQPPGPQGGGGPGGQYYMA